jgi:cyclohexanone monooxygenase
MENFNTIVTGGMEKENLVGDGWTDICHNLSIYGGREKPTSLKQMAAERQTADYIKMSQIRARVDEIVEDPETAQKLKPWYNQFCKRPCFHNEYLSTFNRHNVMLIDTTEGTGIESIDETGVNVKGQHFDLDCIIYATGFESSNDYSQRMGMAIRGKNGLTLSEKWKGGMSTLHGLHTRGFPNSFIISSSQSGFTPNFMHALEELSRHVAYIVSEALQKRKIRAIEPSQEAEEAWTKTVVDLAHLQTDFVIACTPGYYNMEGVLGSQWLRSAPYGLGSPAFFKLMDNWRKDGQLKGLEAVYE